jgi:hypothetical protein
MAVVNNDIWLLGLVTHHPDALESFLINLSPRNGRFTISMSQHAEPEKRQSNTFGEEDFTYLCRNVCKGISNATDNKVLEGCGMLVER